MSDYADSCEALARELRAYLDAACPCAACATRRDLFANAATALARVPLLVAALRFYAYANSNEFKVDGGHTACAALEACDE